jgi:TolA-binding protein
VLSLRSTALALVCLLAFASTARSARVGRQGESADERYSFLVGLCDEKEWSLAAREARAFLEEFPRHAKADLARYRLATALFESGERQAARDVYAQLERRENFEFRAEVSFRLGQCELGLGRHAQAASAFERVLALPPGYLTPAAQFFLGEARFAAGDFAGAQESYQQVLSSKEGAEYEREARYGLCWCSFRLARHDEAIARIEEYLARHGQHATAPELRYLAGEAQLAAGRPREALKSFGTVRNGPFAVRALRGSAFASAALGDHAGAARRFDELLEQAPQAEFAAEAELQRGIQRLLAGDAKGAVESLAARAEDPEAAYWLARAQLEAGDAQAALSSLETALAARPKGEALERLHVLRGDVLSALGRGEDAAAAYSQARSDYALHAAAIAAFNAGKLEEAARMARDGIERFPQSSYAPEMRLVCGEAALARKDYAAAAREFRAASVETASEATRSRAVLREAWCSLLAGDAKAASELAQRVVREFASSAGANEARFVLGRAHDKLGDAAAAVAAWREYVELEPRGEHSAEALAGLARLDSGEAARWSRKLAQDHPESAAAFGALLDLAERDAREGRREPAVQRYREVLERWPEHERAPVARYGLAWCLFEMGEFAAAAREIAPLAARTDLEPKLALSAAELAVWASNRAGEREATVAAYRRFAELGGEPRKLLGAARLAGAALSESGRAEEARAMFDELLGKTRGERAVQAEVLLESAWMALDAKDADEAEAALRTAWKLGPAAPAQPALAEACFFAGELRFEAGDLDRARALYELALPAAAPAVAAQALYKLGFAHLRAERLDDAAAAFARVGEEHAQHELAAESRYLAAECRFRQKRYEECANLLANFAREHPRHACVPKALLKLGVSLGESGRWKECEAALAELARRGAPAEGALEAELWRGRAVAARGDARGARAAFEKVVGADRGLLAARARLELGRLDSAAGKHEDALANYLKVALLYEGGDVVAESLFLAAGALEALERSDKARARYAELVEKHAASPFAARARERLDALGR